MSERARKGVLGILRLLWRLGEQCLKLFFKLFDCQIQPMLTYGSEVWGIMADYSISERVHLFAIKRFLNVSTRTPSALVYGEFSRYPLYVNTYTRCIKYCLNLVRMLDSRIPSRSYKMLYDLHCKNKNNWISYVCFTLHRYGFRFVWENQGVCNMTRFLCEFRQRLIDCCLQDWYSAMASNDRLAFCSSFFFFFFFFFFNFKAFFLQIIYLPLKKTTKKKKQQKNKWSIWSDSD